MATWAKGVDFKNSANTARVGGVGIYGTDGTVEKAYLSVGSSPWANEGLEVTSSTITFKGNKVYHAGSKPTLTDLGITTLTRGSYLTGSNYNGTGATTWSVDATSANTASKVVARDGSGNFSAGTITATLNGNAKTSDQWKTARTITLAGTTTGSVSINGAGNVTLNNTIRGSVLATGYNTAFRTQTKGNTTAGNYLSVLRCNTSGVAYAPQYGSGLAFGQEDTHGYLYVNYSTPQAYIGGGNADKLSWQKELAFVDGNIASATKASQDSAGQQINTTYIKGLSVSGRTITITKGNGSTSTITTQDTTYGTGTASALGLTKLYTGTGTATDGTITQAALTTALNGKANSSHSHNYAGSSSAGGAANSAVKLATARTIALGGILKGSANFDGSGNVTINASANDITTITKSLKATTSWMDTGIVGNNLPTGTYAIQMFINDGTNTSQHNEYYSGIMSWFAEGTNSTDSDEILLHKAGHASNGRHTYLRTLRGSSGSLKLQIATSTAFVAATNITFKFKRLI